MLKKNLTRISNSSTQIAEALSDEILHGNLNPAEKLNQNRLAEQFGVSKIPVREALHRLEADGLITFQANGSATVSTLSLEEAEQVYLEDLAEFPGNGWSLYGLSRSLHKQGKTKEAERALQQYRFAWARADVPPLTTSCECIDNLD